MTADEPSVLTIDMGGDFTLRKVSGQKAIDNDISHMPYKELSFFHPEGSTKHGHSWIYIQGDRPVPDPKRVFGREKELKNIENFLKDKTTLVITGFHGVGKSTLASMFVDRMGESGDFAGIYWRKVNETTDISEIMGSFLKFIRKPVKDLEHYKIADQINLLFKELNQSSYLLVFDNFEILLDPQKNKPLKSKVGFSELIERANKNNIKSKILFTSWDSFASESGIKPFSYQIRGLDTSAGIQLLRREGLTESEAELNKPIELSGGHPLALILLAQLVRERAGALSFLLNDNSLWMGEEEGMAERILNKVYNERISEDERKLLQYVSIFRQPVPARAIAKIANDPVWTESRVEKIAWELCIKSLLQKKGENYWEETLISKYAGTRLSEKTRHHKLAYKYYLSFPLPARPAKKEDFQFLIEAHHYTCMAKEFDQAFKIISGNNLEEQLDNWGNYTVLIDLYSEMLPENYGSDILVKDVEAHGLILGNLGTAYRKLGELRKAIEYYEQALEIIPESENRSVEGILLGNLGLSCRKLGELRRAIEYYEQALKIAKESRSRNEEGTLLGNLGTAYYNLGKPGKATDYYEQSLSLGKEIEDQNIISFCKRSLEALKYSKK